MGSWGREGPWESSWSDVTAHLGVGRAGLQCMRPGVVTTRSRQRTGTALLAQGRGAHTPPGSSAAPGLSRRRRGRLPSGRDVWEVPRSWEGVGRAGLGRPTGAWRWFWESESGSSGGLGKGSSRRTARVGVQSLLVPAMWRDSAARVCVFGGVAQDGGGTEGRKGPAGESGLHPKGEPWAVVPCSVLLVVGVSRRCLPWGEARQPACRKTTREHAHTHRHTDAQAQRCNLCQSFKA